jgi:AcrR family transcriptional regulator
MPKRVSNLEKVRRNGSTQVDAQRLNILDAAEKLFLEKGLESTNMSEIAAEAGITRVSLYRYFPDRHPIAFEIAVRMLRKILESSDNGERPITFKSLRDIATRTIEQFDQLRTAYRYLGMFDHLYGDHYPDEKLAAWYKEQISSLGWIEEIDQEGTLFAKLAPIVMINNCIMSFLQKLAVRGDLIAAEQGVPLDAQLNFFKEMIHVYFDRLAEQMNASS